MMFLRRLHRLFAVIAVPFLLVTAVTGAYILLTNDFRALRLHSWFKWGGVALALAVLALATTGSILWVNYQVVQARRRRAQKAKGAAGN